MNLYPLKFAPILKEKIWGGRALETKLNKKLPEGKLIGESWELSGVSGDESIVDNGFLKGNTINELIEIYMGDLLGDKVYEKYGLEFPVLIKFIDANDKLSIQVHPDDETAKKRHNAYGKTEMWYVIDAEKDAKLISGFNKEITKQEYLQHLENGTLEEILNFEDVEKGDVFFIPAGRVHAICKGILLAEIQQTSDITYRIYDWNRVDADGNSRELHTDLALDVIDFKHHENYKTDYSDRKNNPVINIADNKYFKTNILQFDKAFRKDIYSIDSFIVYILVEGNFVLKYDEDEIEVNLGETILIPAEMTEIEFVPKSDKVKLLEVYI